MCGIAGVVAGDDNVLATMTEALVHRGPDDAGTRSWDDHGVGLGQRRLSIIDLSEAGRNPMPNEDGSIWLTFNGEIYNFPSLRRELEALGHTFRSRNDGEVLLHGYEEWGDEHVSRLRGMFAYAIYDRRPAAGPNGFRLLLVRDRLGIKPLVYARRGQRFLFGSEIKSLLASGLLERTPDRTALIDYLTLLYIPAPRTAYEEIRKLPPAHLLTFDGEDVSVRRYWTLRPAVAGPVGAAEAARMVRERIDESVRAHRLSDVPIGIFLSGGLDSSTVTAALAGMSDEPVRTYSIGFDVEEHSETGFARIVAERFATKHQERIVGVDSVEEMLERVPALYDEPFADGSAVPTLRLAELARSDVKVVLSGDGGDEVFAGYGWYSAWLRRRRAGALPGWVRDRAIAPIGRLPVLRRRRWFEDVRRGPLERYLRLVGLFDPTELPRVLGGDWQGDLADHDPLWSFRPHWHSELDPVTRMQVLDLNTYLPDDILTKVDRASMAVGLEVRPPLVDHELVEFVLSLPPSDRVPDGVPKGLLRAAAGDRLPPEILARDKKGFSAPWRRWMGRMEAETRRALGSGRAAEVGLLRADVVDAVGDYNRGAKLWALLLLERWCRDNL